MRLATMIVATVLLATAFGAHARDGAGEVFLPAAADVPERLPSGAMFMLPRGWTLRFTPAGALAEPPEGDAYVAIIETPSAKDATSAVDAAWTRYSPGARRPVRMVTQLPARGGWDEQAVVEYETSPNEKTAIEAVAVRSGRQWTVLIADGAGATFEKRAAALGLIAGTLQAANYRPERFAGRAAHALDASRIAAMRDFVEASMRQLDIPGAALALIDHDKVVFEGGIGVRALGRPEPVDAHTLFMIASNTKGMTTLMLAALADGGKLSWDEPVTKLYPRFRLGDQDTTRQVLVKHLVCACTGLPRKDLDWMLNTGRDTPAAATFDQLAATAPTSGFGEVFQYNNLMAAAAGYIGGHLVSPDLEIGAAYDGAMKSLVFDPLGMRDTTFDMARALAGDHASPHADGLDGRAALASMDVNYAMTPYRPAGGAWSSVHDMALYVQDELGQGLLPDGRRLVSAKNLLARRAPGVSTGEAAYYGMGLEIASAGGVSLIHHGGSLAGYKSDWVALPDAQVGAVILTNSDNGQMLLGPFTRRLLELLYDGKPRAMADIAADAAHLQAELAVGRRRLAVPAAAEAADALAAAYVNADLGHIAVSRSGPDLVFDFGLWKSRVASRRNDDGTVSFITIDPAVSGLEFVVASKAGKRALIIRDGQHEYVYTEAG